MRAANVSALVAAAGNAAVNTPPMIFPHCIRIGARVGYSGRHLAHQAVGGVVVNHVARLERHKVLKQPQGCAPTMLVNGDAGHGIIRRDQKS